ncbi:MAG: division/cell wall cluster transcriptional repressor MraZ [Clostridia bacterium]|nr:division/cell wall cluster transcriptional repressor MraZ [Clostridia bacterium]
MFLGEYEHTLDAKGRLFIPAKFRDELGDSFIMTRGIDNCLVIYSAAEWQKYTDKINEIPASQARRIRRFVYANAQDCEPDTHGRVVVSQSLREYASIEKDVVFTGAGSYIEVWSADAWAKERENETSDEIAALMETLGC